MGNANCCTCCYRLLSTTDNSKIDKIGNGPSVQIRSKPKVLQGNGAWFEQDTVPLLSEDQGPKVLIEKSVDGCVVKKTVMIRSAMPAHEAKGQQHVDKHQESSTSHREKTKSKSVDNPRPMNDHEENRSPRARQMEPRDEDVNEEHDTYRTHSRHNSQERKASSEVDGSEHSSPRSPRSSHQKPRYGRKNYRANSNRNKKEM